MTSAASGPFTIRVADGSAPTASHGDAISLHGTGLGSRGPLFLFDDFSGGIAGNSVGGSSPLVGPSLGVDAAGGASAPVFDDSRLRHAHSVMATYHDFETPWSSAVATNLTLTSGDKLYLSFWSYCARAAVSNNYKPWLYFNADYSQEYYWGFGGSGDEALRHGAVGDTHWGSTGQSDVLGQWVRFEVEMTDSNSGHYRGRIHRTNSPAIAVQWNEPSWNASIGTITPSKLWFGAYITDGSGEIWLDEIAADTSWKRVELGDSPTFASCTRRELQRFTSWSATQVDIVVNKGGLSGDVYAYVLDENGDVIPQGTNEYIQQLTLL